MGFGGDTVLGSSCGDMVEIEMRIATYAAGSFHGFRLRVLGGANFSKGSYPTQEETPEVLRKNLIGEAEKGADECVCTVP